eukprot:TRINITY_DN30993_c0_g1_i1.p1 TRINITY_DN30993_c0_g1~~TRINITY_DN30993_c0_g1_i1.p1  ORF type:complete len:128 (+),score=29.29 TRINITY_DN30993_c0_g1_i1:81-464(+)
MSLIETDAGRRINDDDWGCQHWGFFQKLCATSLCCFIVVYWGLHLILLPWLILRGDVKVGGDNIEVKESVEDRQGYVWNLPMVASAVFFVPIVFVFGLQQLKARTGKGHGSEAEFEDDEGNGHDHYV